MVFNFLLPICPAHCPVARLRQVNLAAAAAAKTPKNKTQTRAHTIPALHVNTLFDIATHFACSLIASDSQRPPSLALLYPSPNSAPKLTDLNMKFSANAKSQLIKLWPTLIRPGPLISRAALDLVERAAHLCGAASAD